jgi:hypothetical protein
MKALTGQKTAKRRCVVEPTARQSDRQSNWQWQPMEFSSNQEQHFDLDELTHCHQQFSWMLFSFR